MTIHVNIGKEFSLSGRNCLIVKVKSSEMNYNYTAEMKPHKKTHVKHQSHLIMDTYWHFCNNYDIAGMSLTIKDIILKLDFHCCAF